MMKENDLRQAFDQIRPDEALIRATVEKVNAQRYALAAKQASTLAARTPSRYAFAARLVSATCALILAVGIGIVVGRDPATPIVADSASFTRTQFNDLSEQPSNAMSMDQEEPSPAPAASACSEEARAQLLARADQLGTGWMILEADLSGCYILPEEVAGTTACILSFDRVSIVSAAQGTETLADSFTTGTPAVHIAFSDMADCSRLIDAMGTRMCVLVYADGDTLYMDPTYILAE